MAKAYGSGELDNAANLRRLAYFAAVVETGSFTAAAERLGITKAVVSQQIAKLESEFQTTLLLRTTRKVHATEIGQALYRRCEPIFHAADEAFGELVESAAAPSGMLRLTTPFDYGVAVVVPVVAAFARAYPACKVDVVMSDQSLDLVARHIELAIRVGWLVDANLQARRIGAFEQVLVAAPGLVERLDVPETPESIENMPFVGNTALREPLDWTFSLNERERRSVRTRASIFLDATYAVREAVREGAGLSVLPDFTIEDDLASGRLVRVLPQWNLPTGGIHAVYPAARFRSANVRAFVDLLSERERKRQATSRQ